MHALPRIYVKYIDFIYLSMYFPRVHAQFELNIAESRVIAQKTRT